MDATRQTSTPFRSREAGFLLIEVVVATLIAVVVVIAIGLLSENLARRRASADSLSAAVSLAEGQMEQLLALPNPAANLPAGAHGPCGTPPCPVDVSGVSNPSGPYLLQWIVIDNSSSGTPLVDSTASSKKLTVTVSHQSDPYANVNLQTYYDYK